MKHFSLKHFIATLTGEVALSSTQQTKDSRMVGGRVEALRCIYTLWPQSSLILCIPSFILESECVDSFSLDNGVKLVELTTWSNVWHHSLGFRKLCCVFEPLPVIGLLSSFLPLREVLSKNELIDCFLTAYSYFSHKVSGQMFRTLMTSGEVVLNFALKKSLNFPIKW